MGYFLSALPQAAETPTYGVIDTRGPWFLGSARRRLPLSALEASYGSVMRPALAAMAFNGS